MNGVTSNVQWVVTAEERRGYDKQFEQLNPINGFVRGDQARVFFLRSNLPPAVLGQIWELADINGDGKMDKLEFSIAMKLVKLKLQGNMLPSVLPLSMKQQPTSSFNLSSFAPLSSYGSSGMSSSTLPYSSESSLGIKTTISNGASSLSGIMMPGMGGTLPPTFGSSKMMIMPAAESGLVAPLPTPRFASTSLGRPVGSASKVGNQLSTSTPATNVEWAVPKQSKLKYNQVFNSHDPNKTGFISGNQARFILTGTGLSHQVLAQIWNLSDVDNDGKLTQEEFVLAMHLTDLAKAGNVTPRILPANLIPPSYRRATGMNTGPGLMGDLSNLLEPESNTKKNEEMVSSAFATFEDKRRDNFNKGNIELERRRQALEESQRKEKERLEQKEREERERREKERLEQERRRQADLERQLEKQRAAEREREEARKKAIEQREAAQREMERQRQLEWERLRRQELLQQKLREQEMVTGLHAKTKELDVEITALKEKKEQLGIRVSDVEAREREQKMAIDAMNRSRDLKLAAVAKRQEELKGLNNMLNAVVPEKQTATERLSQFKENQGSDHFSVHRNVCDSKKQSLAQLKNSVEGNRNEATAKLIQLENLNTQLNNLREELNKHRLEVEAMNRVQQDKVRDLQEARRAKEASLMRKNSMEKIKKQQQRSAAETFTRLKELKEVSWDVRNKQESKPPVHGMINNMEQKEKEESVTKNATDVRKLAENEIKKEDVKRKIAEMQQKRLEQKKLQEPVYSTVNKQQQKALTHTLQPVNSSQPTSAVFTANLSTGNLPRFHVLYSFQARNPDELTINEGDIVVVDENEDTEPGWYSGSLNGKKGWFPINYVQKIADSVTTNMAVSAKDTTPAPKTIQPPPQSAKPNRSNTVPSDAVHRSQGSAFSATNRNQDASPVPGKGQQVGSLQCKALYPWTAKKENHLTFEKDAIIVVTEQQPMWWFGSCNGKTGWFPKSYVKELSASSLQEPINNTKNPTKLSPSVKRKAPVPPQKANVNSASPSNIGKEYVASFAFVGVEEGDLSFEAGDVITVTRMDGDWWTGTCNNQSGIFPANYVAPKDKEQPSKPAQLSTSAPSTREIATVIAPYTASAPNQLSLQVGQLVLIKKKNDTGWWEGELQARGKKKQIGWFPANYVKIRTPGQTKAKAPTPQPVKSTLPETICQVMAMYDYMAQNNDEMTFTRGAILNVTDRNDPDWWTGYNKSNPDMIGVFPSNYVREISASEASGSAQ